MYNSLEILLIVVLPGAPFDCDTLLHFFYHLLSFGNLVVSGSTFIDILPAVRFDCDAASSNFDLSFSLAVLLIGTLHGNSFDCCIPGRHFEFGPPLQ